MQAVVQVDVTDDVMESITMAPNCYDRCIVHGCGSHVVTRHNTCRCAVVHMPRLIPMRQTSNYDR